MIFHELTEDGPEWGCPHPKPNDRGEWWIQWYSEAGNQVGFSRLTGEALEWCKANGPAIKKDRQLLEEWLWRIDKYIPF